MNFDTSRKDVGESWWIFTENASRIAGRTGSQGNLSPQIKKSRNTTSPSLGVGICSSSGAHPAPEEKNPAFSYSRIELVVTFHSSKTSEGGNGPEVLALTRSLMSASTSPMSSPLSDWTSPSSRLLEPLGEPESSVGAACSAPSTTGSSGRPAAMSSS
jgi:hypothetical protein